MVLATASPGSGYLFVFQFQKSCGSFQGSFTLILSYIHYLYIYIYFKVTYMFQQANASLFCCTNAKQIVPLAIYISMYFPRLVYILQRYRQSKCRVCLLHSQHCFCCLLTSLDFIYQLTNPTSVLAFSISPTQSLYFLVDASSRTIFMCVC